MAYDDIEVEVKVHLTKKKFDEVEKKLKKIAKFIKTSSQIDDYYSPAHRNFAKPKYPYEWLSVRKRDAGFKINYKHWYPEGIKETTHCDEFETGVEDVSKLEKILKALDIKKIVTVNKTRRVYLYKNEIEIAMDTVKDLGYFIEAEAMKDMGGVKKTREYLIKFLNSFGILKMETIPGGYASGMMRKKGLVK